MEKIEGIDLSDIVKKTESDVFEEKRAVILKSVRGIYENLESWTRQANQMEISLLRLREKITKAKEKIEQIRLGNWGVIPESNQKLEQVEI